MLGSEEGRYQLSGLPSSSMAWEKLLEDTLMADKVLEEIPWVFLYMVLVEES